MSFTTVANVQLYLGKDALTAMETAQIEMLIGLVDGIVNSYCGWNMLATDYVDLAFDGNGSDTLDLKRYPVNSLTRVTQDGIEVTSSVTANLREGTIYYPASSGTFSATSKQNILVTFNAGFQEGSIPQELVYAATYLVVLNFNRIDAGNIGVKSEKFNNIDVEYDTEDIPKMVKRVLDRYRAVSIF